jgi:SAM-dependent methyltransferase
VDSSHYSYSFYADPANARAFDERRFGGPIGELVAEQQARVLGDFVGPLTRTSILDVGTGTGRAALLLAAGGAAVTGVDASEEMLRLARERAAAEHQDVRFAVGDAHALEFPNQSFDVAVSLRVLMHTPRWRTCVAELCRVARQRVVLDYPSIHSVAAIQSAARKAVHAVGGRTEPYRVLSDAAVSAALGAHGFKITNTHRQFVLPIALHKAIGSRGFTESSERLFRSLGLQTLFGSPVTIVAERCASS